jgi:hypothetical protein
MYVYHHGPLSTSNLEYFLPSPTSRNTGFLGTGIYVFLKVDKNINWAKDTVYVWGNPWHNPLKFDSKEDLETFADFAKELDDLLNGRIKKLPAINGEYWRNLLNITQVQFECKLCVALEACAKSYADHGGYENRKKVGGIQPLTLVLMNLGFDGIINHHLDNSVWGSVLFNIEDAVQEARPFVDISSNIPGVIAAAQAPPAYYDHRPYVEMVYNAPLIPCTKFPVVKALASNKKRTGSDDAPLQTPPSKEARKSGGKKVAKSVAKPVAKSVAKPVAKSVAKPVAKPLKRM